MKIGGLTKEIEIRLVDGNVRRVKVATGVGPKTFDRMLKKNELLTTIDGGFVPARNVVEFRL